MRRVVIPELLDSDSGTPRQIAQSLADLRHINRWFGGITTTVALLRKVARVTGRTELRLLDVASGSGDVPLRAAQVLEADGIRLHVTLLDRNASHLPQKANTVAGDALQLPFSNDSHDVVSCALFAHHLEPDELRAFAREALRVAPALVINDLIRARLHLALVYAGLPLFHSRITWHDAPVSVRRAYTPLEISTLLEKVASQVEVSRHYLYRMGVVAWR